MLTAGCRLFVKLMDQLDLKVVKGPYSAQYDQLGSSFTVGSRFCVVQ